MAHFGDKGKMEPVSRIAFIRAFLAANPHGKFAEVSAAWRNAGNPSELNAALYYLARSQLAAPRRGKSGAREFDDAPDDWDLDEEEVDPEELDDAADDLRFGSSTPRSAPSRADLYKRFKADGLRKLAQELAADAPSRKTELVPYLARFMGKPANVRAVYDRLDDVGKAAVQEAVHNPEGRLDRTKFEAKYGRPPVVGTDDKPNLLSLFLPDYQDRALPGDLRPLLDFVPPPRGAAIQETLSEPPAEIPGPSGWGEASEPIPVRTTHRASPAGQELRAVLRLTQAGKLRVSASTKLPSAATSKAVESVLVGGDYYRAEDVEEPQWESVRNLTIRAFAWPVLLQATGLATTSGTKLELTKAGREALSQEPPTVLRRMWHRWIANREFDEFQRIELIKGKGPARLTAPAGRRGHVTAALAQSPPRQWIAVDAFFRFVRASGHDFAIAQRVGNLYVADSYYGNSWEGGGDIWAMSAGRFILALLFETAATLGLLDVAYVPPYGIRSDLQKHWGTDDLSCLSRYDGLLYVRINSLGEWILGQAERYESEAPVQKINLRVLPNLDVVALDRGLEPADVLLLDRFADRTAEATWKLNRPRVLAALEEGSTLDELGDFLAAKNQGELPGTVVSFLADLRRRASLITDRGSARIYECADDLTAATLVNDPQLKNWCKLAGDRWLVFGPDNEAAVRRRLRELGYVAPV